MLSIVIFSPFPHSLPCYYLWVHELSIKILRQTFELFVSRGEIHRTPITLPKELSGPANGVYVAAFENPSLNPRGRVGSYMPSKPVMIDEIQHQTITLAKTFPFNKRDLPFLIYEMKIIDTPYFLSDLSFLLPEKGLLVRTDSGRSGISMPDKRKKTPQARLFEICKRENINNEASRFRLYQFNVQTIHE